MKNRLLAILIIIGLVLLTKQRQITEIKEKVIGVKEKVTGAVDKVTGAAEAVTETAGRFS